MKPLLQWEQEVQSYRCSCSCSCCRWWLQTSNTWAISHARAAKVPIVVAINKIDKEGASPDRVKQELSEKDLIAEDWGGDTVMVPVSAIKKQNIDKLLEMILLVSK